MSIPKILHSNPSDPITGSISVPVYQTSTFIQDTPVVNKGYDYTRTNNPKRKALEDTDDLINDLHRALVITKNIHELKEVNN